LKQVPASAAGAGRAAQTRLAGLLAACLAVLVLAMGPWHSFAADPPPAKEYQPASGEFSALGDAVLELLKSGATMSFARNLAPSADDFKAILSTNVPHPADLAPSLARGGEFQRQQLAAGAKQVLDRAAALHLDFTQGDWSPRVLVPPHFSISRYPALQAENETLPTIEKIEIILGSGPAATNSTNGDFKLALLNLQKFPAGWRCAGGIQWQELPSNVADEKTRQELAIWNKVTSRSGLTGQDDPALLKLGEALVHFIRERDTDLFLKEAYVTPDLTWSLFQQSPGRGPSREEIEAKNRSDAVPQAAFARDALKQLDDAGVDLKTAGIQIKEAVLENAQPQFSSSLAGMIGRSFKLRLAIQSAGKSRNGTPLSGEYILAANELVRFDNEWRVVNHIYWQQLPDGILPREEVQKTKLEEYVAQHRALPPETAAPEIEFTALEDGRQLKLSDLKGKVVVLDFWATWCGPCQQPMADLQKLAAAHPDWKGKVAIVPLSIDDSIEAPRQHVDKRGWTNTFNVWAGAGGFQSKPGATFRLSAVPTTYIIDPKGKIVASGHPMELKIEETVLSLLKPKP
jgi:thiol-disulfide isomerase/thioredoxin